MAPLQTLLDIPYDAASGRLLSLDALRPESDSGAALPVVLWVHGGGWYSGAPFAGFETIEVIVRKMNHPTVNSN